MATNEFRTEFLEYLPDALEEGVLYVSMPHNTVAHKCACGCGIDVYSILSPTDWQLSYDGVAVSLTPSIGNWEFPCQSHYWITRGRVRWSPRWSPDQIERGRALDRARKEQFYETVPDEAEPQKSEKPSGFLARLWRRITGA